MSNFSKMLIVTGLFLFSTGTFSDETGETTTVTPTGIGNISLTAGSSTSNATGGNANVGNVSAVTGPSTSNATGGNATGGVSSVGNVSTGASSANASADGAGANSNNVNITQNYENKRQVAGASSPGLTSGFDTCLGSVSGGVQTQIFGLSGGGTKVDKNCVHIKNAHLIAEFDRVAACQYVLANVEGAKESGLVCNPPVVPPVFVDRVIVKEVPVVVKEIVKEVIMHPVTTETEPKIVVKYKNKNCKKAPIVTKINQ